MNQELAMPPNYFCFREVIFFRASLYPVKKEIKHEIQQSAHNVLSPGTPVHRG